MIDLSPDNLNVVKDILRRFIPGEEVWVFGSRVTGKAKPYSDLDLVVVSKKPLDHDQLFQLQDAFEESDLPIRVDVLDWHAISEEFQTIIKEKYVVFQK